MRARREASRGNRTGKAVTSVLGAVAALVTVFLGANAQTTGQESPAPASSPAEPPSSTPASSSSAGPSGGTSPFAQALAQLETLPVKGRAPMTGYERDRFGQRWSDDVAVSGGHNGCDTRNDVLRRDLVDVEVDPDTRGCVVLAGSLADPYSAAAVPFVRGQGTSDDVPIDHVVPLANAWATGAQALSEQQRQDLANDPLNLQPTTRTLNAQKGAGDAATWLPPSKGYRCTYVARQVAVKDRHALWVTRPERDAIERELRRCAQSPPPASTWDVPAPIS